MVERRLIEITCVTCRRRMRVLLEFENEYVMEEAFNHGRVGHLNFDCPGCLQTNTIFLEKRKKDFG